jgi:hypothetical protein
MFGIIRGMILAPLQAASLLILAAAPPPNLCVMEKPTEIEVLSSAQELIYDYSQDLSAIQEVEIDTLDPHNVNGVAVTQGYMQGGIRLVPSVEVSYKTYNQYGVSCIWYKKISITIELDPTIVIAKEVRDDACMGPAVMQHEHKHVAVDRAMVNKYSHVIGRRVNEELEKRGFILGPVAGTEVKRIGEGMQQTVFDIVTREYEKMDAEREKLQRQVDTKAEYDRIADHCPDFQPPDVRGR